ncbi:MAG: hypothetical protein HEQ39_14920 [Rhizobacter sp.]
MRLNALMIAAAAIGLSVAAPIQAQNGLLAATATTTWPQWQGRFAWGLSPKTFSDNTRPRGSSLLGDYYFYRHPMISPTSLLGGFRATSGLMLGSSTPRLLMGLGADLTSGRAAGLSEGLLSPQPLGWSSENDNNSASYLGLGYTLMSLRGGWGLSADIGLATTTRSNTALGSGFGLGRSSLEDNTRDFRLTPLLQLGWRYSF